MNTELLNFELEVMNILQTRAYEPYHAEKVPIIETSVEGRDCSLHSQMLKKEA